MPKRVYVKPVVILLTFFAVFIAIIVPDIHSQNPGAWHPVPSASVLDTIKSDSLAPYRESLIDSVIAFGKKFLGLRYRYGGYTEQGFDCSGYVSYIFSRFGYSFPRSSPGMATVGYPVDIKSARKGDFIFFKGRSTKSRSVGHVALIIAADSGQITMMHSCQRGVIIEKYNDSQYYKIRYLMCRRFNF